MTRMQHGWRPAMAALAAAWLAGCGGGGGGGGPGTPEATIDVTGLRCSGGAGQGWCWQAPQPHGHWVNDVAFTSALDGWAVGDGGRMLRTRDGGATWDERFLPDAPLLQALLFAPDGRQGWLLGADGGRLWRTGDGGDTWVAASAPLDFAARLDRADNGALVLQGDDDAASYYFHQTRVSNDGGATWRDPGPNLLTIDADGTQWHWLDPADTGTRDIRMSTDGGKTFQRPADWPAGRQASTWESQPGGYAWVNFYLTDDSPEQAWRMRLGSGQPWALQAVPPGAWGPLWFGADGRWAAGGQGLWHADASGGAWSAVAPPYADYNSGGYTFVDGRTAWTREQMPSQAVWITGDGGASWVRSLPFGAGGSYPVQVRRDGGGGLLVAANGYSGTYDTPLAWRRSIDQGRSWTSVPGARDPDLGAIAALQMRDARQGLALTPQGLLLQTDDGGRQWQRSATNLPPGTSPPARPTMQFTPDGTGWVFNSGNLYRSGDGGRTWVGVGLGVPQVPVSLHVINDTAAALLAHDYCFVGHTSYPCNHRVYLSVDRGASWRATDPAWPASGLLGSQDSLRLVSAPNAFSTDGGQTWQASRVPEGLDIGDPVRLVRGAGALWLVARYGLLRSNDDGASWLRVNVPLPKGYAYSWPIAGPGLNDLAFADARQGWLVGDGGLVLATTDGGATWQRQASGTSTALTSAFALGPKAVWIGGAQAAVLASTSGGR